MTPLQETVARLLSEYEVRHERRVSGRELSMKIGKSRNHLSQILNDGLVPSGEVLLKLADALEISEEERNKLIIDAMRTKIGDRARDAFWLEHVLELNDAANERVRNVEEFVDAEGMRERFVAWMAAKEAARKKDEAPEGPSSRSSDSPGAAASEED